MTTFADSNGAAEVASASTTSPHTKHAKLLAWVAEVAELTQPDRIHWVDGSDAEWNTLSEELVEAGTLVKLNEEKKPNSFWARTDPRDVARVEDRTYICSVNERDAGPTNNWRDPAEMKAEMTELYRGSMRGRTMYVVPFSMGDVTWENPIFGVEITDSAYVVLSMRIMARIGSEVLSAMGTDAAFVPALHSVGAPLEPGQEDVFWPCNETKYIVQFPEERMIWSYGSGYGGNSLLGKKCLALRIASAMAHDEGWLAEHMLIIKLTTPQNAVHYVAAAFPSACGKTNLAMLEPTLPGWKVETLGDDIAWMRFGPDGRLYAQNPEDGLFGVAPGTGWGTNPNAMRAIEAGNSLFTNVGLTPEGDVWWEGMTEEPPAELTDWRGNPWTPADAEGENGRPAAHPNSRFCTPIRQVPILAEEYESPRGVPISAILFGGRRATTVPLVTQARDWAHGVFMGATMGSETTAAATGKVGVVRRDPMAMLPFLGYDAGDYFAHWLSMAEDKGHQLPSIFMVNWFRRGDDRSFLWPGFGENGRVLKWAIERVEGTADAVESPTGLLPTPGAIDVEGLDLDPAALEEALRFDADEWRQELPGIAEWFDRLGPTVPDALHAELERLKAALEES